MKRQNSQSASRSSPLATKSSTGKPASATPPKAVASRRAQSVTTRAALLAERLQKAERKVRLAYKQLHVILLRLAELPMAEQLQISRDLAAHPNKALLPLAMQIRARAQTPT